VNEAGAPKSELGTAGEGTEEDAGEGHPQGPGEITVPETLHGWPVTEACGQRSVHTDAKGYLALMEALHRDGFEACMGVTGVDYLAHPGRDLPRGIEPQRFEVVVELVSFSRHERLRVRCQVPEGDPTLPSLFDLWPGSEAHERETFDMFGIRFTDHPDLTRILMPEDWEGHPLRKDYPVGQVPVQFKEVPQ
jgi:NADH-quinone oxidoreductase subunit C